MMGTKMRAFAPLPPVSLEDLVPPDHFYRRLERALDLGFVRDLVRGTYAGIGRPSIDPVVFFKLQLILFFEGLRSERQPMRVVADRLSLRWGPRLRPDRARAGPFQSYSPAGSLRVGRLPPLLRGGRRAVPRGGAGRGPRTRYRRDEGGGQCRPRVAAAPFRRRGAPRPAVCRRRRRRSGGPRQGAGRARPGHG